METTKNLHKVSLIFFTVIGFVHIISGLMVVNNYFLKSSTLLNRTLDIPFAIAGLVYLFSSFKLALGRYQITFKIIDGIFIGLSAIIIVGLFYINLTFPDLPSNN